MVTLLFILIAYAIRKRYLPEDASKLEIAIYYAFSVTMTPLFGPWLYKKLANCSQYDNKKSDDYGYIIPD